MKITFIGKVTAHKLVEKKEQVEDGEPIVHEGLELTVDAEASHLSDLCAADAKSKVRLLVRKSDAEIEAWSNGILNTPPEDRAEMCAEDPSVLDVPAEHIRRLKARLAAAPSGEPDALTRGERAELLAWRAADQDWEAYFDARAEARRLRAENEAARGSPEPTDNDPDPSITEMSRRARESFGRENPWEEPPAGRAAAEPPEHGTYAEGVQAGLMRAARENATALKHWSAMREAAATEGDWPNVVEAHRQVVALNDAAHWLERLADKARAAAAEAPDMVAVRRFDLLTILRRSTQSRNGWSGEEVEADSRLRAAAERAAEGPR